MDEIDLSGHRGQNYSAVTPYKVSVTSETVSNDFNEHYFNKNLTGTTTLHAQGLPNLFLAAAKRHL